MQLPQIHWESNQHFLQNWQSWISNVTHLIWFYYWFVLLSFKCFDIPKFSTIKCSIQVITISFFNKRTLENSEKFRIFFFFIFDVTFRFAQTTEAADVQVKQFRHLITSCERTKSREIKHPHMNTFDRVFGSVFSWRLSLIKLGKFLNWNLRTEN